MAPRTVCRGLALTVPLFVSACAEPLPGEPVGFDTNGAPLLAPELLERLDAGGSLDVLVRVDDGGIAEAVEALRGPEDEAGDRPTLLAARAAAWEAQRTTFLADLPPEAPVARTYRNFPVVVVRLDDADVALDVAALPGVLAMEADTAHEHALTQSLPLIHQPEAEAAGFRGVGTSVAVLDTGLDWTQSAFGPCDAVGSPADTCRVVFAADMAPEDNTRDAHGHGTNVGGIVAGVAPGADLIALDVFRSDGYAYSTDILLAIDWVIDNQALYDIASLNMSLGSGSYTATCGTNIFASGIIAARQAGVLSAVASGNNAYTASISQPACVDEAISVGAVYDSNMGGIGWSACTDSSTAADKVTCFSNSASFLDVLAPGARISAAGSTMGGTSMAAPHVAGAIAVLRGADPNATVDLLEERLEDNGTLVTDSRNGIVKPRIDLEASLADCVSGIDPMSFSFDAAGETGAITVTTTDGCEWEVASSETWVVLEAASGTGTTVLNYTVDPNTGASRSATITLSGRALPATQDADPIPVGTVVIDAEATGTNTAAVELTLDATDASGVVTDMCVSNTASCSSWIAYDTALSWTVTAGAGTKTVYVWFRDEYGNESAAATDTIVLDTTAPSNGTVTASAGDEEVTLAWSGFSDAGSGVASYALAYGTSTPTSCASPAWTGTDTSATVTGLTNGTSYGFRVCAIDGAGNTSSGGTATGRPAPEFVGPSGSISINGGAAWAKTSTVTLSLSATDASGVSYACVSNTSSCSSWFAMTSSKTWTLASGTGTKTVYAWYKDAWGNTSAYTSDSIGVDTAVPGNGTVTVSPDDTALDVSWTGFTDAASGVASYKVVYGTSAPSASCTTGTTAYTGTATSTTISGLTNGTLYTVRVCAVDAAANTGTGSTATGRPAPEFNAPTGTISIAAGAGYTRTAAVSVTLAATDDTAVSYACLSNTSTCSTWFAYTTTKTWTLTSTAGTKTLYGWFKDSWGNTSAAVTDTIVLDATGPSGGTLTATGSDAEAALSWNGISDSASGIASYKVVRSTGTTAPTSCSTGTTVYSGTGTSTTNTGLTNGYTYGYRVCGIDNAGNTGTGVTTTVRPAPEYNVPTGSVVLASGATWTKTRSVAVAITGSDDTAIASMCIGTSSTCTSWVTYDDSTTTSLSSGNGTKTVKVWLKDTYGNVSSSFSDTIGLDATAPSNGTVTATAGSGSLALSWSGYSDSHSGIAGYKVVYRTGSSPTSTCSDGTVAYQGTSTTTTISSLTPGTRVYVRVCADDTATNRGTGATAYATPL